MDKVKVGFIGAGRISDLHAIEYGQNPNAELVALCDANPAIAAAQASGGRLHLMGLYSPGNVHACDGHVRALIDLAARLGRYMQMDEEHHLYTARVLLPTRRIVRLLGERLVDRGVLEDWDEIHFLTDRRSGGS